MWQIWTIVGNIYNVIQIVFFCNIYIHTFFFLFLLIIFHGLQPYSLWSLLTGVSSQYIAVYILVSVFSKLCFFHNIILWAKEKLFVSTIGVSCKVFKNWRFGDIIINLFWWETIFWEILEAICHINVIGKNLGFPFF